MRNTKVRQIGVCTSGISIILIILFFVVMVIPKLYGIRTKIVFVFVMIALIATVIGMTKVLLSKRTLSKYIIAFFVLTWGMVYTIVFPPNTEPDGNAHWGNVLWLSNNYMNFSIEGRFPGREEEIVDLEFDIARTPSSALYSYRFNQGWINADEQIVDDIGWWHFGAMIQYYPSVFGATIARQLGLGVNTVMYMGRVFNILFFCLVCMLAVHICPYSRNQILMYVMIPMVPYIYASLSYDIMPNAYLLLYFSLCMRIKRDNQASWGYYIVAYIMFVLILPFKGHFVWFGLIIFILTIEKIYQIYVAGEKNIEKKNKCNDHKGRFKIVFFTIFGVTLLLLAIYWGKDYCLNFVGRIFADGYVTDIGEPCISVTYVITHFAEVARIYFSSVVLQTPRMLYEMIGGMCYGRWLPVIIVVLYYVIIVLGMYYGIYFKGKKAVKWLMIPLLVYLTGFFGCMISYTAIGRDIITGVWGRYFLPVLMSIIFLYSGNEKNEKILRKLLYIENLLCVLSVCVVLHAFL